VDAAAVAGDAAGAAAGWLGCTFRTLKAGAGLLGGLRFSPRPRPSSQALGAAGMSAVTVGVLAVLASSLLSGFANVYFEKVVKTKKDVTIWVRNVQLGLFSLPQAATLLLADRMIIANQGLFVGFNTLAWTVVTLKALGGLLVAAVVKYADNVLKTYATAIAIVLTCVVTCVQGGIAPSLVFLQGMAMVIASIFMYNLSPRQLGGWVDSMLGDGGQQGKEKPS